MVAFLAHGLSAVRLFSLPLRQASSFLVDGRSQPLSRMPGSTPRQSRLYASINDEGVTKLGTRKSSPVTTSSSPSLPSNIQNTVLLGMVPALWGSYGIAAKILYDLDHPVPLTLVNLGGYLFALLSLFTARQIEQFTQNTHTASIPKSQLQRTYRAGFELGLYLYIGSFLNLEALAHTSASRSAFLVQLTTVIIPFFDWVLGAKLSKRVLLSCVAALTGAFVLSQGSDPDVIALSPVIFGGLNSGDLLAILAAAFYSLHVLRLEVLSKNCAGPLLLVQSKAVSQVTLSLLTIALVVASGDTEVMSYVSSVSTFPATEVLTSVWWMFWIGAGTTALATWAQVVGQERVGPTRAAVIYASQPVWAAGLACAVGLDRLTGNEILGGALIVAAGAIVALPDGKGAVDKDEDMLV